MENNMDFRSYDEMLNYVLSISNEEEKARIIEEDELFKKRGWKKYILFIGNCFSEDRKADWNSYGGSARDSYLLYKVSFPDTVNTTLLTNEEAKSILFNDALRVRIKYIKVMSWSKGILEEFQRKLDSMSSELGLKYKEKLIQNNEERIIVSSTDIPTEDFDLINNEKKDSNEEEKIVLRKYLIINFLQCIGL